MGEGGRGGGVYSNIHDITRSSSKANFRFSPPPPPSKSPSMELFLSSKYSDASLIFKPSVPSLTPYTVLSTTFSRCCCLFRMKLNRKCVQLCEEGINICIIETNRDIEHLGMAFKPKFLLILGAAQAKLSRGSNSSASSFHAALSCFVGDSNAGKGRVYGDPFVACLASRIVGVLESEGVKAACVLVEDMFVGKKPLTVPGARNATAAPPVKTPEKTTTTKQPPPAPPAATKATHTSKVGVLWWRKSAKQKQQTAKAQTNCTFRTRSARAPSSPSILCPLRSSRFQCPILSTPTLTPL